MNNLVAFLSLALAAGCTVRPSPETATVGLPLPEATNTMLVGTATIPPTVAPTVQPTSSPLLSTAPTEPPTASATLEPIQPRLGEVCPSNSYVPLEKLGLPDNVRLLAVPETVEGWDYNNEGVFSISSVTPDPEPIADFSLAGYLNWGGFGVSPDNRWLMVERKMEGTEKITIWILSADGQMQWPLKIEDTLRYGIWLDSKTLLMRDSFEWWRNSETIFYIINPFTGEGQPLTDLPSLQIEGVGAQFFIQAGKLYLIYQKGYDYHLFDTTRKSDELVLEWLRDDPADFLEKRLTILDDGRVVIRIDRPYGFDLSEPQTTNELVASNNYTTTMRPVIFPDSILPARGSTLLTKPHLGMFVYGQGDAGPLYYLNLDQGTMTGLCFSEEDGGLLSPDGTFSAITRWHLPSTQPVPKTLFIINLQTGHVTRLDDYAALTWVRVDE